MSEPAQSRMKISVAVAIATYNRGCVLLRTIPQLFGQSYEVDEILIVDQSEVVAQEVEDTLLEWAKTRRLQYFRLIAPNLPAARNHALRMAKADIVIFIDDDVILGKDFVKAHVDEYISDLNITAVAGGVEQAKGWGITRPRSAWPAVQDYMKLPLNGTNRIDYVGNFIGCNHSVRRTAALETGCYDELYQGMALREDTDLAIRLVLAGKQIVYAPRAHLLHLAAPSEGCRKRDITDVSGALCLLRFSWKFRDLIWFWLYKDIWKALRISILSRPIVLRPYLWPKVCWKLVSGALLVLTTVPGSCSARTHISKGTGIQYGRQFLIKRIPE